MCNLLLADEINRTSPKTQSALLEVMEEGKVTIDGTSQPVPDPFIVIATQNPFGSAGTQLLPESQVDRFMICMNMGYPDMKYEIEIVKGKARGPQMTQVYSVMDGQELIRIQKEVEQLYIHDAVYEYIGKLVTATRNHNLIELGLSPRGTISIAAMARAHAFLRGREYVVPEDVHDVFGEVSVHRLRLNSKARINHVTVPAVVEQILEATPKPTVRGK